MSTLLIENTTHPDSPIDNFQDWLRYIVSLRLDEGEERRFKRDIEPSFDRLHRSLNEQGIKR